MGEIKFKLGFEDYGNKKAIKKRAAVATKKLTRPKVSFAKKKVSFKGVKQGFKKAKQKLSKARQRLIQTLENASR